MRPVDAGPVAALYVCGITPYDATHLGHAATYVTFDLVGRALRDAGHRVHYVQNVTDVDDPLLERAARDGRDWRELATAEIDLFREDMTALAVVPPTPSSVSSSRCPRSPVRCAPCSPTAPAYRVPVPDGEANGEDVYLDLAQAPTFGSVSGWTREQMDAVFADRGGDPDRAGKRNPFDPLLWRAARDGEPCWDDAVLGAGRPGLAHRVHGHLADRLGHPLDIQGGGTDLVFPHHEMSAVQSAALTHDDTFARHYVHQAMVGYEGAKMSKSRGNLVLVSRLRADGVDPMAIRLVLLDQHYRTDWDYTPDLLDGRPGPAGPVARGAVGQPGRRGHRDDRRGARRHRRRPRHPCRTGRRRRLGRPHPGRSVGRPGRARARGAHGGCRARRPPLTFASRSGRDGWLRSC